MSCYIDKIASSCAQWLAHWPLVLEVSGSIPAVGKKTILCPSMLSAVSKKSAPSFGSEI